MTVGILIEASSLDKVDYLNIEAGNPGIGGTEYLLILLAYQLSKFKELNVIIYCKKILNIQFECTQIIVEDEICASMHMQDHYKDGIFIFIPKKKGKEFYCNLNGVKAIAWAHNYLSYLELKNLAECADVRRVVFVGKEQYESYCDDRIFSKSTYIFNMVVPPEIQNLKKEKHIVTYTGALIHTKGFHKLAKQWKKIVNEVSDAELYVVGSGKLYNRDFQLGKYNIASKKYEKYFMPYLLDDRGNILRSVHFLGSIGSEKAEIYSKTMVGVVNPTGKSETFCLSAVEFEGCGIPVVAYNGYGYLDTVINGKTGLLSKTGGKLKRDIVKLLCDEKMNTKFGANGVKFYSDNFTPEIVIQEWIKLLRDVDEDIQNISLANFDNIRNNWKWIKLVNMKFQSCFGVKLFSVSAIVSKLKSIVKSIIGKKEI